MRAELDRLNEDRAREANWKRWGPYLSERQWGTVREDYSANGDAWGHFPHDHARSRAYRWGEDGLLGIADRQCRLCFALALWNGRDPILKERLFGLSNPEGNHGEDVKERYHYLDSTPTHSYMKALYRYPQAEFPYARLVEENARRGRRERELELEETGAFDGGRFFDVFAEYAKASPDDLLIRVTAVNRGADAAPLWLLPTLWFRNSWIWGCKHEGCFVKPRIDRAGPASLIADHVTLRRFRFEFDAATNAPELLFTENETNTARLYGHPAYTPYVKDAFHEYLIKAHASAVNPAARGTKAAGLFRLVLAPGESVELRMRLFPEADPPGIPFGAPFDDLFARRIAEADAFYDSRIPGALDGAERSIARQAYAGLLWSKQFYHYVVDDWLEGDADQPPPPPERKSRGARNADWRHVFTRDILSMPDKWEYPWFAAWDHAFHMLPFARVDPDFAKGQLALFLREWYMHPNGQIPAYEWALSDVNPPVHAWACWRVYKRSGPRGSRDTLFLRRAFQKLLINFTWWINRKDPDGRNIFSGGFLGLDNIGVFDRSAPLPEGGRLEQADATAWMGFYCVTMMEISFELARADPAYEDVASKFFEHFISIVDAMNHLGGTGLWDEQDGFYYDQLLIGGDSVPLRTRSLVGLIPLIAVGTIEGVALDALPGFRKRMDWFLEHRQDLARHISYMQQDVGGETLHTHRLLAIPSRQRLVRVLGYMLDEAEFLSPFGVRSLSRVHLDRPFVLHCDGVERTVGYVPGESDSGMFGGNSNWRGPVWFPVNFLLIEALERYHHFYGDTLRVECPTGSGRLMNLREVARELARRLASIFLAGADGRRPFENGDPLAADSAARGYALFHEYFHGETGRGLGASHQTGWTALVIGCLEDMAEERGELHSGTRW